MKILYFLIFTAVLAGTLLSHDILSEMTLEEKVGQILMVHFEGEIANDDAQKLIQELHVGGIILYNWANGLYSPNQVHHLNSGLQTLALQSRLAIPLLITIDQEGGTVSRLNNGFTIFPGNKTLGLTEEPKWAEDVAFAMGQEMKSVGITLNLAPVIDIGSNNRTYGSQPQVVTTFAQSALRGYHNAHVMTCLKHFPGLGSSIIDSHQALPVLDKSKESLVENEFIPFKLLASQTDAIMTAHLLIPSLDTDHCSTLSRKTLSILRDEIGFEGLIISDSLVMEGLLQNCPSVSEAAILAFQSGCDVLLLGGKQLVGSHLDLELKVDEIENIHRLMVHAVEDGRIPRERLDASVTRILAAKNKYQTELEVKEDDLNLFINIPEHRFLAEKINSLNSILDVPIKH